MGFQKAHKIQLIYRDLGDPSMRMVGSSLAASKASPKILGPKSLSSPINSSRGFAIKSSQSSSTSKSTPTYGSSSSGSNSKSTSASKSSSSPSINKSQKKSWLAPTKTEKPPLISHWAVRVQVDLEAEVTDDKEAWMYFELLEAGGMCYLHTDKKWDPKETPADEWTFFGLDGIKNEAEDIMANTPSVYHLMKNNCQDFATRLFFRILYYRPEQKPLNILRPFTVSTIPRVPALLLIHEDVYEEDFGTIVITVTDRSGNVIHEESNSINAELLYNQGAGPVSQLQWEDNVLVYHIKTEVPRQTWIDRND